MQALPDSCCARAMSYLELREVELVGECSLKSKVRACSRELWLMLCEQRWPAIASSEALRKALMMRHPRDYFMHTYLEHHLPRPLLDLDEHLVHLELFSNPWIGHPHGDHKVITLHYLINDMLMAFFFAIAGKEAFW